MENGQHRYIPGYWKLSNESSWRIDLPEPPQSVEAGPNVPAPHNDAQWIPGHWVYRNDNYVWQPGYWGEVEDNMVWTPGQYNYTGSGYRYVNGYWDYCLEDRGLLFAPVFFTRPLWLTPGWAYQPCFGINIGFGGGWGWGWGGFYDNLFIGQDVVVSGLATVVVGVAGVQAFDPGAGMEAKGLLIQCSTTTAG